MSLFMRSSWATGRKLITGPVRHPSSLKVRRRAAGIHPVRMRRTWLLTATMLALVAPAPAFAAPAITVTDFTLTLASPDGGASVDASSSTSLAYSNVTEDVKETIGHFATGMIANPEAVPHCPQAQYLADACPADTLIGSAGGEIDPLPNSHATIAVSGRIYNQELLAGEAGRLGIILDTAPTKTFLTAPFYVRSDGDYGLDGVLDDLPRALTGIGLVGNTQIDKLSFTLFGVVNGRKYTRAPTNCALHVSTGEAIGYDDPTPVTDGPASSYTPTNCDKLSFKPSFSIAVGSKGTTGERDHPPLDVHVAQGAGEAGIAANAVTLPFELGPNLAAFDVLCTSAQLAASACPAGSQVGTTTATSAFVATPLSGPVYLVQLPGVILPALVADLRGRVHVQLTIANTILGGRLIKSTVTNVPDLPVSTFDLKLDGGAGSPLENKFDLCKKGSKLRAMTADVTFTGQNGATVASKPRLHVPGCGPVLTAKLRHARRARSQLSVKVSRHPDGGTLARFTLTLPKELHFVRPQATSAALVLKGRRRVTVSSRRKGASTVSARLAVSLGAKARRKLRHGRKLKLRYKVVAVETGGTKFKVSTRARVR